MMFLGAMCTGSPPHTWRILRQQPLLFLAIRITSTYVENTAFHLFILWENKDHLHIRGEYILILRARQNVKWITSTYVENTKCFNSSSWRLKDHLHIRGEYAILTEKWSKRWGSPPHTWRILLQQGMAKALMRITSTYVENTNWS